MDIGRFNVQRALSSLLLDEFNCKLPQTQKGGEKGFDPQYWTSLVTKECLNAPDASRALLSFFRILSRVETLSDGVPFEPFSCSSGP
jgi:hypothetical protein